MKNLNNESCADITAQNDDKQVFQWGWQPGDNDVIIGRGRRCNDHIGNIKFRRLVRVMMKDYVRCKTRTEKSIIITALVDHVRHISPDGGFVKRIPATGQFYDVGKLGAREKTSQTFRDALHELYASSKVSKRKCKQLRLAKLEATKQNIIATTEQRTTLVGLQQEASSERLDHSIWESFFSGVRESISLDDLILRLPENNPECDPFEPLPIQEIVSPIPVFHTSNHNEISKSCQVLICPFA